MTQSSDAIVYRVARRHKSAFFQRVSLLESFSFGRDRLVFCAEMSDSETSTPAGTSQGTPTRVTQWSRKRAKLEQVARMRSWRWKRAPSPAATSSHSETSLPPVSSPVSTASLSSVPSVPVTPTTRPLSRQTPLASAESLPGLHSLHLARCALVAQAAAKGGSCKNATRDQDFGHRSEEEPLSDTSSKDDNSPQEIFDDWMVSLRRDQRQMLSVILMEHRLNLNVKQAATEAGSVVGFNKKTVRRYRNEKHRSANPRRSHFHACYSSSFVNYKLVAGYSFQSFWLGTGSTH